MPHQPAPAAPAAPAAPDAPAAPAATHRAVDIRFNPLHVTIQKGWYEVLRSGPPEETVPKFIHSFINAAYHAIVKDITTEYAAAISPVLSEEFNNIYAAGVRAGERSGKTRVTIDADAMALIRGDQRPTITPDMIQALITAISAIKPSPVNVTVSTPPPKPVIAETLPDGRVLMTPLDKP